MYSLETLWKLAFRSTNNTHAIKTGVEAAVDIQKITWPTSIVNGTTYNSLTDSVEFTIQATNSGKIKALPTVDDHPEFGDADVKEAMKFAICENVTKGFFFRIHHSSYPEYGGEMYIMPVEEDNYPSNGFNGLRQRYSTVKVDNLGNVIGSATFDVNDQIRVFPYKLVQSEFYGTCNKISYLWGHPDDWPAFIKSGGALNTRPLFSFPDFVYGTKGYRSYLPDDIPLEGTPGVDSYKYFVVPKEMYIDTVITNGELLYSTNSFHTTETHTSPGGYGNSYNATEHRISWETFSTNAYVLISGTMFAPPFGDESMHVDHMGWGTDSGEAIDEAGFVFGETDRLAGKQLYDALLNVPMVVEGYNPENIKLGIVSKGMTNGFLESFNGPNTNTLHSVKFEEMDIGIPVTSFVQPKIRAYVWITKDNFNYRLNMFYEELVPNILGSNEDVVVTESTGTFNYEAGQPVRLPIDLDNPQFAGLIVSNTTAGSITDVGTTYLSDYYIVNGIIYTSAHGVSGWKLYVDDQNTWGVDQYMNFPSLQSVTQAHTYTNSNGVRCKAGCRSIKLPFPAHN